MRRGEGEEVRRGEGTLLDSCTSHLPTFPPSHLPTFKSIIVLSLAILAIYAQTIGFGFLRFDDPDYTFACPFVKDGLSWKNVVEAFRNVRHGAVWMPLTWISYMADISLFGRGASGHHLVNVALHLANTLLLFRLVLNGSNGLKALKGLNDSRTSSASRISSQHFLLKSSLFLATLFWALHPQRVEAVAWIASRKELLWAFFALIGLLAWRSGKSIAALACCALACMSKPTAMVFPLLAMVMGQQENATAHADPKPLRPLTALRPLMALSFMFALSLATGALAIYSQTHPEGMAAKELFYASLGERLLNAATALGLYLAQMVVPVGIHLDYRAVPGGWPLHAGLGLSVFAAALLGIVWLVWRQSSSSRISRTSSTSSESQTLRKTCDSFATRAILFFLLALFPTLGLFGSFGEHARADRFLYVPAMAVPLFFNGLNGLKALKVLLWVLLVVFAFLSFRIAATYRDDLSAFSRTLACDPFHWRALAHVGEAECAANDLDAGLRADAAWAFRRLGRDSRHLRPIRRRPFARCEGTGSGGTGYRRVEIARLAECRLASVAFHFGSRPFLFVRRCQAQAGLRLAQCRTPHRRAQAVRGHFALDTRRSVRQGR